MTPKTISFTPEVLKAKLRALEEHGRCQTRRPVRCNIPTGRPVANVGTKWVDGRVWVEPGGWAAPPFGVVGQRLWIRERARVIAAHGGIIHHGETVSVTIEYALDVARRDVPWPDRLAVPTVGHCIPNGVHREGARHFLEVVEVRAELVADISEQDALLEGIEHQSGEWAIASFFALYDSIYGGGAHARDWCWVYTLKRATP